MQFQIYLNNEAVLSSISAWLQLSQGVSGRRSSYSARPREREGDIPELAFTLTDVDAKLHILRRATVLVRGELGLGEKTKLICDKEKIPFAFSFPERPFIQQFWPLVGDDKLVSMWLDEYTDNCPWTAKRRILNFEA